MFLHQKIKLIYFIILYGYSSLFSQLDTNSYYLQWKNGLSLIDKDFVQAKKMLENAIFGFANEKYWHSATYKALEYSEILTQRQETEHAKKWLHYAADWSVEQLGAQNLHYCQILENASLLNFLNGDFLTAYQILKKTLNIYQKCERIDPSYLIKLHQNIATWSEKIGNWNDAFQSYHFLYHQDKKTSDYLIKLAHIAYENLDYWNAKNYFLLLQKEKVRDTTFFLKLSECYLQLNKIDSAEYFFNLYTSQSSKFSYLDWKYFEIKAWLSKQSQAYQEAIDAYQQALQLPHITDFQKIYSYWNIGKIWFDLGLLENAESWFKNAVALCSDSLFIKFLIFKDLSELYLRKGNLSKAEELLLLAHPKFYIFLGRFHLETIYLDELLGKLYFQKKEYSKSYYYYTLALENAQYHHDLHLKTLKIRRKIIAISWKLYQQNQNFKALNEILKYWKSYVFSLKTVLQYAYPDEELYYEIQNGLMEATEAFLEAFFRKGQKQHLISAYYCHWLWKKIKQKSIQQVIKAPQKYLDNMTQKRMLQNLILKEASKPEYSALKLFYWANLMDTLNQKLLETRFSEPIWFDPFTKSLFTTELTEAQIAYFIGTQHWIIFVHYQDHLFYKIYDDNYELKKYLYLLKKGNENPENVSVEHIYQKLSTLLFDFPLKQIKKFPKIKTLNISLDEPMFHIELEKLSLPTKMYVQKKLVPFK